MAVANTPTLDALRAAGAYNSRAQAVVPTVTLVNHASMLGGMSPEKHGINWNIYDPALGKIKGPTLFSVAQEAGLTTAMVVGKPKLEHIVLPNSVSIYNYAGFTDRQVVNQALPLINSSLPDILFIHLPDVDSAGHATGWMSPGQLLAIENSDGLIGELMTALETVDKLSSTLLIVTSDHGGSGQSHGTGSAEDTFIPWLAVGPGVPPGKAIDRSIMIYDTAATVLQGLKLPIPADWDGRPVSEIFN
jgi:predicted AlkP superfamily pyrophosphatase or phosphodiesterase